MTQPEPGPKRSARGRRTCLYCYAPLRVERAPEGCAECGEVQSKLNQEQFWSLEPLLLRWQRGLRAGSVGVTVGIAGGLTQVMDASSLVWGISLVALAGGFMWYTAGCVTRRSSFLDLRFLWPPLVLMVALGPLVISLLLGLIGGEEGLGERVAPGLVWAALWVPALVVSLWLPRWFGRFRQGRVERGVEE